VEELLGENPATKNESHKKKMTEESAKERKDGVKPFNLSCCQYLLIKELIDFNHTAYLCIAICLPKKGKKVQKKQ
jgi:hypothetical protein